MVLQALCLHSRDPNSSEGECLALVVDETDSYIASLSHLEHKDLLRRWVEAPVDDWGSVDTLVQWLVGQRNYQGEGLNTQASLSADEILAWSKKWSCVNLLQGAGGYQRQCTTPVLKNPVLIDWERSKALRDELIQNCDFKSFLDEEGPNHEPPDFSKVP